MKKAIKQYIIKLFSWVKIPEYRLTASLWIMIIGCFIEYSRHADYVIFAMNIFILIAKILDTIDLFQNQKVADPSLRFKDNNYNK